MRRRWSNNHSAVKTICAVLVSSLLTFTVGGQEFSQDGTAYSQVYSHVDSYYTIVIPSTVQADGSVYNIEARGLDLCPGDRVVVSVHGVNNGEMTLSTETGKTMVCWFNSTNSQDVINDGSQIAVFDDNSDAIGGGFYITQKSNQGAGNYTGNITFDINLIQEYVLW